MRLAALGLAALLAACSEEKPLPPERPDAQVAEPAPIKLPAQLDYAGRWAVSPDMCETGWWDLGPEEIVTAGELSCAVSREERTAATARLQLTCVGEGMPTVEYWDLRAEANGRLSVTRDGAPPVVLTRCARS